MLTACNEADAPSAERLSFAEDEVSVIVGETLRLEVTVSPDGAEPGQLTWSSSDIAVAEVDATGLVTATGVGRAVVTASYGRLSAECTVSVLPADGSMYSVEFTEITPSSVAFRVTPVDPWLGWLSFVCYRHEAEGVSDDDLFAESLEPWRALAEEREVSLSEMLQANVSTGIAELSSSGLESDTDYCIYVYGIDYARCERVTPITRAYFKTLQPAAAGFDIDISWSAADNTATASVASENYDGWFYIGHIETQPGMIYDAQYLAQSIAPDISSIFTMGRLFGQSTEQILQNNFHCGSGSVTFPAYEGVYYIVMAVGIDENGNTTTDLNYVEWSPQQAE